MRAATGTHKHSVHSPRVSDPVFGARPQRYPVGPKLRNLGARLHLTTLEGDVMDRVLVGLDSVGPFALEEALQISTGSVDEACLVL
jgi:hypothetical protein